MPMSDVRRPNREPPSPLMTHLSEIDMALLVSGRLTGAERARAERHLDECEDCRRCVAALIKSSPTQGTPRPTESWSSEAVAPEPGQPLHRGALIGRYVILERLGQGGMGVVFAAYDPKLQRKVALKLVRPQAALATAAARLRAGLLSEA